MLILALLLQAQAPVDPLPGAWGAFTRAPALAGTSETVEIATDGRKDDVLDYRLRRVSRQFGTAPAISWADSRTCPAVRAILTRVTALPMPHPVPPGFAAPGVLYTDGIGYALHMPTRDGTLNLTSNIGTPLAAWVDRSLAELAPCWSPVPPPR